MFRSKKLGYFRYYNLAKHGGTKKKKKEKRKRKDGLVEIPNSIAGIVYLFNVIRNIGICVGGTWL